MSMNPGMYSSATDQHNTPLWLVDKVKAFLGYIELDPCTSDNNPCGAERFFTEATDGLSQAWEAHALYMNPPYGRGIGDWTTKMVTEYEKRHFAQGIALLPARTDTTWWAGISDYPALFMRGRLKFNDCKGSAPFPSVLVYFGNNWAGFAQAFAELGHFYVPVRYKRIAQPQLFSTEVEG